MIQWMTIFKTFDNRELKMVENILKRSKNVYIYATNSESCPLQIKHSDTRQEIIRRYIISRVAARELLYYKISTQ